MPFTYTDFEITELVVEVSPLATYITVTRNIPEEYADQRTAYYVYCDEEGKEYREIAMLSAVNVRSNEDGNWDGVPLTWAYDYRGELPASIILRAVGFDDRDKSVPLPEDLVVPLTEVTEP